MTAATHQDTGGIRRSPRVQAAMAGALLSAAMGSLDQGIVNTALPAIASQFQALPRLSWIVTAFMLTSTITTPIYGALSDIVGRRRMLLISLALFTAGSALCGAARSMDALILFRALQGLGSGGLITLSLTIIGELVPPPGRPRAQGTFSGVIGVCSIAGPILGGFITSAISWRWTFYVNLPVGALALALIAAMPPTPGTPRRPDRLGMLLVALATTLLLLLLAPAGARGPGLTIGLLAGTVVAVAATLAWEGRAASPILELDLFRNPTFRLAIAAVTLEAMAFMSMSVALPLLFQLSLHVGAAGSGALLLPQTLAAILGSVAGGRLAARPGWMKPLLVIGSLLGSAGIVAVMLLAWVQAGRLPMLACLALIGLGSGICYTNLTVAIQNAAPTARLGGAMSVMMFLRWLSASAGVALSGALLAARLPHGAGAIGIASLAGDSHPSLSTAYRHGLIGIFALDGGLVLLAAALIAALPRLQPDVPA